MFQMVCNIHDTDFGKGAYIANGRRYERGIMGECSLRKTCMLER